MKIDWKAWSGFITFLMTLVGGFYKLDSDNKQMVIQNESINNVKYIRWQVDSLRMERKMQELRWDMRDSIRVEIARLKDELR